MLSAIGIGIFEVVGSFGAASDNDTGRKGMDALAVVLILLGPLALAVRDRWPLGALAVTLASAAVYVGLGYVYGPIFLSIVVALIYAVLRDRRRGAWVLAGAGYVGFIVASQLDPRADGDAWLVKYSLVAGWMIVALVVAELIRSRRTVLQQRASVEAEARQRREGEQRLELAQELHDVLAHHISLINVQAGVALHLIDEQPERARPALADIKEASREALRELRGALDILRRGEAAPKAPAPTLADLDRLVAAVRASGLDVRVDDCAACRSAAGGGRAGRLPHRAGGADQRVPPRRRPVGHGAPALRRRRDGRGDRRRRRRDGGGRATASPACASGPPRWAATSRSARRPAAASGCAARLPVGEHVTS